ncbi:hypothetical protein NSK_001416 [Nannochloropsis salina CCMP1776]|uniref:CHCH domain-containing protein n=1 Tax=Nannochloropsis salina CCMP1776 TaxID=1027361 RepID=A0A4D9D689_9STRA|nr:hypothetical protein NSK_001416 [Nannochloropsis salina CCMP1776]|eukprot:TFJ87082.1 hypothetical protein NSK_001416 [Nannochloropsis salina CCMP1776]
MNPFGGASIQAKPPEKGSFPLDRAGQCRAVAHEFLGCIEIHKRDYSACKDLSKAYLQCRMDKNLMQQEDLSKLGFDEKQQESGKAKDEKTRQVLSFNTDILV